MYKKVCVGEADSGHHHSRPLTSGCRILHSRLSLETPSLVGVYLSDGCSPFEPFGGPVPCDCDTLLGGHRGAAPVALRRQGWANMAVWNRNLFPRRGQRRGQNVRKKGSALSLEAFRGMGRDAGNRGGEQHTISQGNGGLGRLGVGYRGSEWSTESLGGRSGPISPKGPEEPRPGWWPLGLPASGARGNRRGAALGVSGDRKTTHLAEGHGGPLPTPLRIWEPKPARAIIFQIAFLVLLDSRVSLVFRETGGQPGKKAPALLPH